MTKAQAATVVGDLVTAGFQANAYPVNGGAAWQVDASSTAGPIDVATIQTFATNHGVSGKTNAATFS